MLNNVFKNKTYLTLSLYFIMQLGNVQQISRGIHKNWSLNVDYNKTGYIANDSDNLYIGRNLMESFRYFIASMELNAPSNIGKRIGDGLTSIRNVNKFDVMQSEYNR